MNWRFKYWPHPEAPKNPYVWLYDVRDGSAWYVWARFGPFYILRADPDHDKAP